MQTPPLRLTELDLERVQQIRSRYRLESDTDAVRLALYLALTQPIGLREKIRDEYIRDKRNQYPSRP